jgi:hypothetical protein
MVVELENEIVNGDITNFFWDEGLFVIVTSQGKIRHSFRDDLDQG